MSILFTNSRIGGLELPNRLIRAASHEGLADEMGRPTERQFKFYEGFVKGGVSLVITGYAGISQAGKSALLNMTMIDSDELIPAHSALTDKIHGIGGRIFAQIAHCGRQTWSSATKERLLAPSAIMCGFYKETPKEMTDDDIQKVIGEFSAAALRAKNAGYDGVEIHGAHGYLLSTFMSAHSNRRADQWGGSLENRFRIVGEVLRSVRSAVGRGYPVILKLNSYERALGGTNPSECAQFALMAEKTGCLDAVEISCGTTEGSFAMTRGSVPGDAILDRMRPYKNYPSVCKSLLRMFALPIYKLMEPPFEEGYNIGAAAMVKKVVSIPVIALGGMRSKGFMEDCISSGRADFISMARPLILEPDLPNKFRSNASQKALCDNCNECVVSADTMPIRCYKKEELVHAK